MSTPPSDISFGPVEITFDAAVLTPRPWTLSQSEWAADLAQVAPPGPILELCCGAGQIGLAAAKLAGRPLVQVDDNPVACRWARRNAAVNGVNADVRAGDFEHVLEPHERFPVVIADPPYLASRDTHRYPSDPLHAIDGGDDGLDLTRRCIATAAAHALPGAPILLQVRGPSQAAAVRAICSEGAATFESTRACSEERAVVLLRSS